MADEIITHSYLIGNSPSKVLPIETMTKTFTQLPGLGRRDETRGFRPRTTGKNRFSLKTRLTSVAARISGLTQSGKMYFASLAYGARRAAYKTEYAVSTKFVNCSVPRTAGLAILSAAVLFIMATSFVGVGLQVYVDGNPIGFVSNQDDFMHITSNVESKVSRILGSPYLLDTDIEYKFEMYNRQNTIDEHEVEKLLFSGIDEISKLYTLKVDGEVIGASEDGEAVSNLLNDILYKDADGEANLSFKRNVELDYQYADSSLLCSISELSAALNVNVKDAAHYTIQAGDLFSDIAARHGLSVNVLAEMNPGIDVNKITQGDVLVVSEAIPFMSIEKLTEETYDVEIPYGTEYVNDDNLYSGTKEVKVAGVSGLKSVTAKVTYTDGKETDRVILTERVTSDPVTEVVRMGTKKRITTGSFIIPCYGTISSRFGGRTFSGSYDFHKGIDFATKKGSNIIASDGGTVTTAKYSGNYGYLVVISHGNGVETYYAHCSKLLVSVGQKVAQGELIAKVGSTGRSTGSHCHFEIRINGTAVNPAKYLW
jgi:murein DD-endopeptidase MepM/ murein hydrolase activator NlpD